MIRAPARVLEADDVRRLLAHVDSLRHPTKNRVIVLTNYKAGLRACEISRLTWPMVLTSGGEVAEALTVPGAIAKYGGGRIIPLQLDLKRSLRAHHRDVGRPATGYVVLSERGDAMKPQSIVNWFSAVY